MSVLPLSGPLQSALSYFTLDGVPVQDVTYLKVSGMEEEQDAGIRGITAAIDPSNMKQLEILFGIGNVSAGDILIYTLEELFISDIFPPGGIKTQSFLTYSNFSYRIMAYQDWIGQAGINVYQGRRHVRQQTF